MPRFLIRYVRLVDALNRGVGRIVMYGIFVMMGILLWSSISKTFFYPSLWTLETAQFALVVYYVLGGPYSIQMGSNVRMDLFYGDWTDHRKAWFDATTVLFLMFYLGVLLYGALGSTAYSLGYFGTEFWAFYRDLAVGFVTGGTEGAAEHLGYLERSSTAWRPYMWPIKLVMILGFTLMLLQSGAELVRDIARIRGADI